MKKPILRIVLIIAVVLPAFSQRILKDIAQGTDNAYIFSGGSFSSGDTLYFVAAGLNYGGHNFKYYQTKGTTLSTKKLIYEDQLEFNDFGQFARFYKFNNTIYGINHNMFFKIKNDSIQRLIGIESNYLMNFFELNNELHFFVYNKILNKYQFWKINALNDTPSLYQTSDLPRAYTSGEGFFLNTKYYHSLITSSGNYLVSTDGTPEGLSVIQNNKIGIYGYQKIGNKIYYPLANTGEYWYKDKLWRTQGDSVSTMKVLTSISGDTNYSVSGLFKFKNNLYFTSYLVNAGSSISKLDTNSLSATHISSHFNSIGEVVIKNQKIYYQTSLNSTFNFYENSGDLASEKLLFSIPDQGNEIIKLYVGDTNYYVSQQRVTSAGFENMVTYWIFNGSVLKKISDLVPNLATGLMFNAIGVVGNIFYFSASDSQHGYELLRTDGTIEGTYMVKDINTKPASSFAKPIFGLGNYLYFMADDISHGYEIWRTDGFTSALYADLNGSYGSNSHVMSSSYNYNVKFRNSYIADINTKFYQFTPDGNMKSLDFLPIYYFSIPHEYKNLLYFMGSDGNLWKTDCTIQGTKKAIHLDSTGNGTGYWGVNDLKTMGNILFFTSNNGSIFWKTDGTKNGTSKLYTFLEGNRTDIAHNYLTSWVGNSMIYFQKYNYSTQTIELWASDATPSGTVKLNVDAFLKVLGVLNNKLYFVNNNTLWQSDGTIEGTFQIDTRLFLVGRLLDNKLYLLREVNTTIEYYELKEDNTISLLLTNTEFISNDNTGTNEFSNIDERYLLHFISDSDNNVQHFYLTDGNKENIRKAFVMKKSYPYSGGYDFAYHNKKIYFTAVDSLKGQELWIWDFECPDGYTIRDNITKDSTIVYGKNIWGQNVVSNNKTVTYDAKNGITLQPGFEVQKGTVFKTKLIGCANNTSNIIDDNMPVKNEPLVKVNVSALYPQLIDFLYYYPNKSIKEIYEQVELTKLAPITWEIITEKDIYRLDLKIGSSLLKGWLPKKN